jgi:hypothetical protein
MVGTRSNTNPCLLCSIVAELLGINLDACDICRGWWDLIDENWKKQYHTRNFTAYLKLNDVSWTE